MRSKLILLAALAFFSACSSRDELPKDPKDGQEYKDQAGNTWLWNAMLLRWMVLGAGGGTHYYYPATGRWTNANNVAAPPPSSVNPKVYKNSSYKANSKSAAPATPKQGSKSGVFGTTGRSHPAGA